ncbi:poly(R)-hydroxyalkanoic acid synthase subunit PhaE [Geobacter sp.]|uniref:poly(R)-hydroxyalkanoic acid synthase subunit PhaE n=1 Tax=Geobacter sp. TaxID=46610 RepID=UPI002612547C|nr:poly(R)-hydroxyalkanoic acid synthase subunit PhaE [Geobacter sp.]
MQDFFKQQTGWLKTWQENQETLTKQYVELSKEWMENILGSKKEEPDFFDGWFKSQSDLTEQFREFSKRLNEMIQSVWSDKVPPDVLKFMNISFFEEFYKNWLSSLELPGGVKNPLGTDGGWQQATKFLRSFLERDHPFFSTFSNTSIAGQMSRVFGMLQGALGQEEGAFGELVSGYLDSFNKLFESTTAQATEKLAEGFDAWAKEMEKHLLAPKLGINRELAHDISQALVMSQKFVQTYIKMARLVEATSRKAGIRFQTKLSELALNKKPVAKFTDLCALWAVENETVFLEVMGSEEFARLQGDFVDAGHRLKIQWNKLAEKALDPTPIALKRDLDLAIAEIHQLKRDMRTFQRVLKEMEKEARAAREAQVAAEDETKKAKAAETAAQDEAKKTKAAEAAAREEAKKAKAAEAAAQDEAKKAKAAVKTAEAAAKDEAKKAKTAEAAVEKLAKQVKADKAASVATTKSKSKNA